MWNLKHKMPNSEVTENIDCWFPDIGFGGGGGEQVRVDKVGEEIQK